MNIAICTSTFYDHEPPYVSYTDKLKLMYCRRHGMTYSRSYGLVHPEAHPMWDKSPRVRRLLSSGYDWVIWMDADAAPVGMDVDISGYLSDEERKVIMARDYLNFNAGVFAVPNTERSEKWLRQIESMRNLPCYSGGWRDQLAVIDLFKGEYSDYWKEPDESVGFNDYLDVYGRGDLERNRYREGKSWCLHIPGKPDSLRNDVFGEMLDGLFRVKSTKETPKRIEDRDSIDVKVAVTNAATCTFRDRAVVIDRSDVMKSPYASSYYGDIGTLLYASDNGLLSSDYCGYCMAGRYFGQLDRHDGELADILKDNDIVIAKPCSSLTFADMARKSPLASLVARNGYGIRDAETMFSELIDGFDASDSIPRHSIFIARKDICKSFVDHLKDRLSEFMESEFVTECLRGMTFSFADMFAPAILGCFVKSRHLKCLGIKFRVVAACNEI